MPLSLVEFLEQGAASSKDIQAATGLSQAAVSRQLRRMEHSIVTIRSGRTPKYVMTKNAFGGSDRLPLAIVDPHGNTVRVAYIRPLVTGGFYVEPLAGASPLLLGENREGIYEDLPYFLHDIGPQGFLGRQIAKEMNAQFQEFPPDPKLWTTDHIGRYLVSNGDDLPGNFKFGEQALLRVRRKPVAVDDSEYPRIAEKVMEGEVPESSAGGEQPKFTTFSKKSRSHVIVKFSSPDDNAISRRWRDVLATEYHAIEALHRQNFPAAETRLFKVEDRFFLESQRFDRSGEYGRMSMISLASIDAEFVGQGTSWPVVLDKLMEMGLVAAEHVFDAEFIWCFGKLINNTDMHLGNLSFSIDGDVFRLLPVYDMCSMGFAPKSGGEVPQYSFIPKHPQRINLSDRAYSIVMSAAIDFWNSVASDDRISDELKSFLAKGNPVELMG